jgi:ABC-type multidrug transport system fused ATPase/permease subunit
MKKGKMAEFGTHNELMKNVNGPYSQMYHMQFDKKSTDIS